MVKISVDDAKSPRAIIDILLKAISEPDRKINGDDFFMEIKFGFPKKLNLFFEYIVTIRYVKTKDRVSGKINQFL